MWQKKLNSITYRITGLMFVVVGITVLLLIYLANVQMTELFQEYLQSQNGAGQALMLEMGPHSTQMGASEELFLSSVHQSLKWVGAGILLGGLLLSYALARSMTVPLRSLAEAAKEIEKGNFGNQVTVKSSDEIGQLALLFNRMSQALATNDRLRQRFLADIAHELKTPLAVIQGHLEGMLEGVVAADPEQIASLYDETVHLNRLIKDLRDLSLAEAGQLTIERSSLDINQLIHKIVYMIQPLADEKEITLQQELQSIPLLQVDSQRMTQVLYNLLTNALRYTPKEGLVRIMSKKCWDDDKSWVIIRISDTGAGIEAEDLPHIFDHFYRADLSRNRMSGGSGIGLAIVKQLVEIHGGKVAATSLPGQGSTFSILLPLQ